MAPTPCRDEPDGLILCSIFDPSQGVDENELTLVTFGMAS